MKANETRIGWMENRDLSVSQWSCPVCTKIFYFVDDDNDEHPPRYCPLCGRKNLRANT